MESQRSLAAKVFAGKSLRSLDRGEEKVTGGPKRRGRAKNGTSR